MRVIDCDVLVFGDQRGARQRVVELARAAGLRGLHGGALVNSAAAEALTSVLIFINKTYAVDGAGIRITGALTEPAADEGRRRSLTLTALAGMPEVLPGSDLAALLAAALDPAGLALRAHDVLVVAQKVISKAEGRYAGWRT